jgi:hypothetical protein
MKVFNGKECLMFDPRDAYWYVVLANAAWRLFIRIRDDLKKRSRRG